jgi:hypothetical protein
MWAFFCHFRINFSAIMFQPFSTNHLMLASKFIVDRGLLQALFLLLARQDIKLQKNSSKEPLK